jgi:hypothetical protein
MKPCPAVSPQLPGAGEQVRYAMTRFLVARYDLGASATIRVRKLKALPLGCTVTPYPRTADKLATLVVRYPMGERCLPRPGRAASAMRWPERVNLKPHGRRRGCISGAAEGIIAEELSE